MNLNPSPLMEDLRRSSDIPTPEAYVTLQSVPKTEIKDDILF